MLQDTKKSRTNTDADGWQVAQAGSDHSPLKMRMVSTVNMIVDSAALWVS